MPRCMFCEQQVPRKYFGSWGADITGRYCCFCWVDHCKRVLAMGPLSPGFFERELADAIVLCRKYDKDQ
jgi:hypothetical protein